jgi:hypothetical protein
MEDCRRLETPSREEAEEGKDDDDDDDQQDDGEGAPPFVGTLFAANDALPPSRPVVVAGRTGAGPGPAP